MGTSPLFRRPSMKRLLSLASILLSFAFAVSLAAQTTPTSGTQKPGTQTPGTQTPGTQTPGAQTPGEKMTIGSDADYATHMKEIGQLNGVLNKSIKAGAAEEATKAATRLEVLFKNVHGYWNEKKVADATTAAQTAVTSPQAVQKALAANDMMAAVT